MFNMASYVGFVMTTSCNTIDIRRLIDTCLLLLCDSNHSQMCKWKIMNTEETERKKSKEKTSIWKPNIGLLNFLRNKAFTVLATSQIFCYNYLVNRQTWTTYDVRFSTACQILSLLVCLFVCEIYLTSVKVLQCSF